MMPAPTPPSVPMTRPREGRAWRSVVLALALASSAPALAVETRAPESAAPRASAVLDFRIVIPEAVRFVRNAEQRDRTRQFTSRTVGIVDGGQLTRVARP